MAVRVAENLTSDPSEASFPLNVPRKFVFKVQLFDDEVPPGGEPKKRTVTFRLKNENPFFFDPAQAGGPLRKAVPEEIEVSNEPKTFMFVHNIRRTGDHSLVSFRVTLEVPGPINTFCSIEIKP